MLFRNRVLRTWNKRDRCHWRLRVQPGGRGTADLNTAHENLLQNQKKEGPERSYFQEVLLLGFICENKGSNKFSSMNE